MRAAKCFISTYKPTGQKFGYKSTHDSYEVEEIDCTFHQFAQESEEGSVYPVAIVELDDGTVLSASLSAIRFID